MKPESYSDPTVSALVDQAFNLQLQITDLKAQVLEVTDQLDTVRYGYRALNDMLVCSNVSIQDCQPLLAALNVALFAFVDQLHILAEGEPGTSPDASA
jgi:hypothetical protein